MLCLGSIGMGSVIMLCLGSIGMGSVIMLCLGSIGMGSVIMLCLGSIGMGSVICKLCYKGTTLQNNYRKMTMKWSFSYNSFVKFHD